MASKEELLDGMIDLVVAEIDPPVPGAEWKSTVRQRILSARRSLLRHRWAAQVIESRKNPTPAVLAYMDSMIGMFRTGGFSVNLTHHVMHTIGSRVLGSPRSCSTTLEPSIRKCRRSCSASWDRSFPTYWRSPWRPRMKVSRLSVKAATTSTSSNSR